jgi:hypothetical protein
MGRRQSGADERAAQSPRVGNPAIPARNNARWSAPNRVSQSAGERLIGAAVRGRLRIELRAHRQGPDSLRWHPSALDTGIPPRRLGLPVGIARTASQLGLRRRPGVLRVRPLPFVVVDRSWPPGPPISLGDAPGGLCGRHRDGPARRCPGCCRDPAASGAVAAPSHRAPGGHRRPRRWPAPARRAGWPLGAAGRGPRELGPAFMLRDPVAGQHLAVLPPLVASWGTLPLKFGAATRLPGPHAAAAGDPVRRRGEKDRTAYPLGRCGREGG